MEDELKTLPYDARIIGCIDTNIVNTPLFETDDYKLLVQFDDCTPETQSNFKLLDQDQANEILRFILTLIEGRVRHDLHVHCIGGQSRSAAIASFAAWLANLDQKYIKTNNPFRPNPYVLKMLNETYSSFVRSGSIQ